MSRMDLPRSKDEDLDQTTTVAPTLKDYGKSVVSPEGLIDFTQEEVQESINRHGRDYGNVLAQFTSKLLNKMEGFEGQADYNELKLGIAPILNKLDLPADQRGKGLSDEQILKTFSSLVDLGEDGAVTKKQAFTEGAIRGGSSFATGVVGAKLFASAAPPYVPLPGPLAPLGTLSKPIAGVTGFLSFSLLGDKFIGQPAAEALVDYDREAVLTPKARATFRAYESAGNVLPFIFMPWTLPKAQLNTAHFVKRLPLANRTTVLTAEEFSNPLINKYLSGKLASHPTTAQFNSLKNQLFKTAKEKGEDITLKQAGKLAAQQFNTMNPVTRSVLGGTGFIEKSLVAGGQRFKELGTLGKAGVVATESLAVPATLGLVGQQERIAPEKMGYRLLAELGGGIAPNISLLKFAPTILKKSGDFIRKRRESKALGQGYFGDILGTKERARLRAINDIYTTLDENMDKPDELLKQLESKLVDPVVENGEIVRYTLKKDIKDSFVDTTTGKVGPVFSSQFVDNPSVNQLEQLILSRSGSGALDVQKEASFQKSTEMQRGLIFALRGTGDPELVKLAGELMQSRLSLLIQDRQSRAVQGIVESVKRVYPDGGPEASKILGQRINKVLKEQNKQFRTLEQSAWAKTDKNTELTNFFRKNKDGELIPDPVPNVIEEWDAILNTLEPAIRKTLLFEPKFKVINDEVLRLKKSLGLDATDRFADELSAVSKFNDEYSNAEGLAGRDSFDRMLARDGVTNEPTDANISLLARIENQYGGRNKRLGGKALDLIKLKRESLIAQKNQLASDVTPSDETIMAGDISGIYKVARGLARTYGTTEDNFSRVATSIAEAALDDLNSVSLGNNNYDVARDISFAYNEYLKRTFGGEVLRTNFRGQSIVDESLVTDKLLSGKPDAVALRIEQIQEIGNQIRKYSQDNNFEGVLTFEGVERSIGTSNEVLADALKLSLRNIELPIEARTLASPEAKAQAQNEALQQFVTRNGQLFESFPQLKQMIDESGTAGEFLKRAKSVITRFEKRANEQKAFQKLTKSENPERAIDAAFKSDNPTKELDSLIEVLKAARSPENFGRYYRNKGGTPPKDIDLDEAKQGLRNSVMDFVFKRGGSYSDQFDSKSVYDTLFIRMPNAKGDDNTLAKYLSKNDMFSEKEINQLRTGLTLLIQTESRKRAGQAVISGEAPALLDFYTRITGARLGGIVGQAMPGGRAMGAGLIEAEAGSKYLRQITQELPALQEFDALEKILLDPELFALALRKPRSAAEKGSIVKNILDGLKTYSIGVVAPVGQKAIPLTATEIAEPEVEGLNFETEQDQKEPVQRQQRRSPKNVPVSSVYTPPSSFKFSSDASPSMNAVRGGPQPVAQATPPASPPAQADPQTREKYAALFPNDPTSAMIKGSQGGIGSLFG